MSTDPEDFVVANAHGLKEQRHRRGDFVDTLWRLPAFALVLALAFFALGVASLVLPIDDDSFLLELFHGPTAAFKDFGARFLAEALSRLGLPSQTGFRR